MQHFCLRLYVSKCCWCGQRGKASNPLHNLHQGSPHLDPGADKDQVDALHSLHGSLEISFKESLGPHAKGTNMHTAAAICEHQQTGSSKSDAVCKNPQIQQQPLSPTCLCLYTRILRGCVQAMLRRQLKYTLTSTTVIP